MLELWGTGAMESVPMSVATMCEDNAPPEGSVRATSILGLQSQLDQALAELAEFRSFASLCVLEIVYLGSRQRTISKC